MQHPLQLLVRQSELLRLLAYFVENFSQGTQGTRHKLSESKLQQQVVFLSLLRG